MKTIRFSFIMLAAIALAAPVAIQAEDQGGEGKRGRKQFGGPGGPGGPGGFFGANLTEEEKQKLMAAREKALADDPSLKATGEELRGMREKVQSGAMSREDAFAKMKEHNDKMNEAMIKADPSVAPIIEKIKADMKQRWAGKKGPGGPGGAPGGGAGGAFGNTPPPAEEPKKADQ